MQPDSLRFGNLPSAGEGSIPEGQSDSLRLGNLPSAGEESIPEGQREAWTERLIQLVLQEDTPPPLRAAAGAALAGEVQLFSALQAARCKEPLYMRSVTFM